MSDYMAHSAQEYRIEKENWAEKVTTVIDNVLQSDPRFTTIAKGRFGLDAPRSLSEIGQEFGVSRERVRQLQASLLDELLAAGNDSDATLNYVIRKVQTDLGTVVPLSDEDVRSIVLPAGSCLHADVILQLSGPYLRKSGVLTTLGRGLSHADLIGVFDSHGVADRHALNERLKDLGVVEDYRAEVVLQSALFASVNGVIVSAGRSVTDRACTILALRGEPMCPEEILDQIEGTYSHRSLTNRLLEDLRFIRTDINQFGLATWSVEEYSGITQEIRERIERSGGSISVDDLVIDLTRSFAVKESSIRAYVRTPEFVLEEGLVRLRLSTELVEVNSNFSSSRGAYVQDQLVVWHMPIDADTLRGSGRNFPNGLACRMGIYPGTESSFESVYGICVVTWRIDSITGASISSMRSMVSSLKGFLSDEDLKKGAIRIRFDLENRQCQYELIFNKFSTDSPTDLVRNLTGLVIQEGLSSRELLCVVAAAIDVPSSNTMQMLRTRGDVHVASALVSNNYATEGVAAAAEQLAVLLEGLD